ncbi:MAG: hypothetical protein EKK41_07370 [Hyphomicrobiales bacterium]|nr:MAG: hypothetical protein EKK41_07370 [Hyphomicrobiales bacterium]
MMFKQSFITALTRAVMAVALASYAVCAHADDSLLLRSGTLPLMGNCLTSGLSFDPRSNSEAISTIACSGRAAAPIALSFSGGETDQCVYIDNADPKNSAYFVPVRTLEEWTAFKQATRSGSLHDLVTVTYGCEATTIIDSCGKVQALPLGRHGDVQNLISLHTKALSYQCVAVDGCGTWSLATQSGSCPTNGMCGTANGLSFASTPTAGLCESGDPGAIQRSGNWTWRCEGIGGGTGTDCWAYVMEDGVCGLAAGVPTPSLPSGNLCSTGWAGAVTLAGNVYSWTCSGEHGGDSVACAAPKAMADCNLPWGGTIADGASVTAYRDATVSSGGACVSETRTCNNGSLSGSYGNASCSVSVSTCRNDQTYWCGYIFTIFLSLLNLTFHDPGTDGMTVCRADCEATVGAHCFVAGTSNSGGPACFIYP